MALTRQSMERENGTNARRQEARGQERIGEYCERGEGRSLLAMEKIEVQMYELKIVHLLNRPPLRALHLVWLRLYVDQGIYRMTATIAGGSPISPWTLNCCVKLNMADQQVLTVHSAATELMPKPTLSV